MPPLSRHPRFRQSLRWALVAEAFAGVLLLFSLVLVESLAALSLVVVLLGLLLLLFFSTVTLLESWFIDGSIIVSCFKGAMRIPRLAREGVRRCFSPGFHDWSDRLLLTRPFRRDVARSLLRTLRGRNRAKQENAHPEDPG